MIAYINNKEEKELIASTILTDLSDWFGLPDSTAKYVKDSKELPFWAEIEENTVKGFITLKENSKDTCEIYVMGVLKTVQEGRYKGYDQTNQFYKKIGFKEFECFPTLWDEWNPCQILVMAIK